MVREIGDTTVQLSWSRGFDNHSPIAKYTLQARTLPGKWKQVRTSKCELPPPQVSPELAWLNAGGGGVGGGGQRPRLSLELQRWTSVGPLPAGSSQVTGEDGHTGSRRVGRELGGEALSLHP